MKDLFFKNQFTCIRPSIAGINDDKDSPAK
jgi:hypothetical protein